MPTLSRERFAATKRHRKIGGAIDYSLFEDCDGSREQQRGCIADHFEELGLSVTPEDRAALDRIEPTQSSAKGFLGDWYDVRAHKLIARGHWYTESESVDDPTVESLDRLRPKGSSGPLPEVGGRGQFAYAFFQTPYGLHANGAEKQADFEAVWATLSPPDTSPAYFDWSSDRLTALFEPYYKAGAEWWGVFLFTIYVQAQCRLWVMSASTTD
jgi:hypothetical protein